MRFQFLSFQRKEERVSKIASKYSEDCKVSIRNIKRCYGKIRMKKKTRRYLKMNPLKSRRNSKNY